MIYNGGRLDVDGQSPSRYYTVKLSTTPTTALLKVKLKISTRTIRRVEEA